MEVPRHEDPVQCKTCGFEGPSCTAATCPRCRTIYDAASTDKMVAFTYASAPDDVLCAVTDVVMDQVHAVAVVRKVRPGLYHIGGLERPEQVDSIFGARAFPDMAKAGDVLYLDYEGRDHRLLNWGDPAQLRTLVS